MFQGLKSLIKKIKTAFTKQKELQPRLRKLKPKQLKKAYNFDLYTKAKKQYVNKNGVKMQVSFMTSSLAKGIMKALEKAGININNPADVEKALGLVQKGKTLEDLTKVINHQYGKQMALLFYQSESQRDWNPEYFTLNLKRIVEDM